MKLSLAITLDGLVRALRTKAHALADDRDHRYRVERASADRAATRKRPGRSPGEKGKAR
jgi:hypothetical protein